MFEVSVEEPDTSVLDKSDFKLIMRAQTGSSFCKPIPPIPKLLSNREIGVNSVESRPSAPDSHLTCGLSDRCKFSDNFLPNKMSTIEQYPSKGRSSQLTI